MANSTAREFLYIVQESALGTPVSSPVIGTNSLCIRLIDGNSFTMYAKPVQERIPYGGGLAVTSQVVSDHYECKGQLKTKLYASQAQFLLNWALFRINSAQTSPWTTTELAGDLASCSVYHAVRKSDGTYYRKVFGGTKVAGCRIEVSRDSTTAMLTLDLQASTQTGFGTDTGDPTTTPFPVPTEAQMPLSPYTFNQTAGQLSIGGSTRTQYRDLSIDVKNALSGEWFESQGLSILNFFGRESTLSTTLYFKGSPDDRSPFELSTPQAASVTFENGVTGQNLTVTFNSQNVVTDLPWDLPLDKAYTQKLNMLNTFDQTAAEDIGFSFA
jgi:hypothetical protein